MYNAVTQRKYGKPAHEVSLARHAVDSVISDGDTVLVACSGGVDSMALLDAALFLSRKRNCTVKAVVVDHQLQAETSQAAYKAKEWAQAKGIEVFFIKVQLETGGLETQARKARYEAFELVASQCHADIIMTAHHQEDQAETVLLSLLQGSGPRSLAGIPPARGKFRRPFLSLSKEQLYSACRAENVPFWEDPSNQEDITARNIVRQKLLPEWENILAHDIRPALAKTAALCREEVEALDFFINQALDDVVQGQYVNVVKLRQYPAAVRKGVLQKLAIKSGAQRLSYHHLQSLDTLVVQETGEGTVELPRKVSCTRVKKKLFFAK
ncbi:MAG: tRNA lysidine(34) synthetase TilS [Micrococcaceae bacterium]